MSLSISPNYVMNDGQSIPNICAGSPVGGGDGQLDLGEVRPRSGCLGEAGCWGPARRPPSEQASEDNRAVKGPGR